VENPKFISARIAALLRARGRSECEASLELGMNRGYMQSIVSGRTQPSIHQLYNIADYFGLSMSDFFDQGARDSPAVEEALGLLREMDERDVHLLLPLLRRMAELVGSAHTRQGRCPCTPQGAAGPLAPFEGQKE